MVKLYVLTGLPGSGKSSFAVSRKNGEYSFYEGEKIPNSRLINVVSRDAARLQIVGSNINKENFFSLEAIVRKTYYDQIRFSCFKYLEVFCDATQIDVTSRRRVLNSVQDLIKCGKVEPYSIFINTPVDECIRRDATREGIFKVGEKEIIDMAARLIIPTKNEGFIDTFII